MLKQSIELPFLSNQSSRLPDDHLNQIEKWLLEKENQEEHILKRKLNKLMMTVKRTIDSKTPESNLH